ncbi:hypothetical protein H5410_045166 [Solanum commersonii]|uniref:Uncharacterized protein n=1 Tax=Solanum commersonii TaxID=4109 RepID=A0A9J5XBZ4_SOLCO|nr:hypothetical protein H5410_045166 [Solanum commersonii]
MLTMFLTMTPKDDTSRSNDYFLVFIHTSIPAALVKIYIFPSIFSKQVAHGCIFQSIGHGLLVFMMLSIYIFRGSLEAMMEWYDVRNVVQGIFHLFTSWKQGYIWGCDVRELIKFIHPVKCLMCPQEALGCRISFPSLKQGKSEAGRKRFETHNYKK